MKRLASRLAQWPVLLGAWAVHGAALLAIFAGSVDFARTGAAVWAPVGMALLSLVVVEAGLLVLATALPRAALEARGLGRIGDALTAVFASGLLAVLTASTWKFRATSVHLRASDLWFLWANFRQIAAEGLWSERVALFFYPLLILAVTLALFLLLGRPAKAARARLRRGGLVWLAAALLLSGCLALSPQVRRYLAEFVPETHWVARRLAPPSWERGGGARATSEKPEGGRPIEAYRPGSPREPLNVVLVILESLSWKHLEMLASPARVAPHLLGLLEESLVFTRVYAPSSHSDYSQMALLSSLHPRKYPGHDFYLRLRYPRTLLWDALRPAGYATSLFSCQNERWGNMLNYLDTPGLEVLRHSLDWPRARHKGDGIESKVHEETPVGEWRRWVEGRHPYPYLTVLNFQATHFPYVIPPEAPRPLLPQHLDFRATFVEYPREKVPVMRNRFGNALAYADRWLGEVRETLRRRGDWERTVLVLVSDHGEAFYEHGQPTHGTSLYEEQIRAFLAIRTPGIRPRQSDSAVSLLDVAPALLELLGLPPHPNFQGRGDILDPTYDDAGRPLFFTNQGLVAQDGVLLDGWKYLRSHDTGRAELYHLPTDPGEVTDRAATEPARLAELAALLDRFLESQLRYYASEGWTRGHHPPALP